LVGKQALQVHRSGKERLSAIPGLAIAVRFDRMSEEPMDKPNIPNFIRPSAYFAARSSATFAIGMNEAVLACRVDAVKFTHRA
jgi:hypothetical protein